MNREIADATRTAAAEDSSSPAAGSADTVALDPPLVAGTVLADRYRLLRPVGRGGMGSVWEAEHLTLGTPVAIKLIHQERANDELTRSRFLREARAAATLRSPNVVQIFDYGLHEGTPYIAMELMSGESLADRLERGGMSPDETLRLMQGVFRAIAKAHAMELVHRDLKPDNIFIVPGPDGGVAKVLDFGIAKGLGPGPKLDATTQTGAILGTPFYMSPEQLMDSSVVDTRTDLWALAVIVYECIVGKRPFSAESVPELAVKLWSGDPVVPSAAAEVPAGFDGWFARATKREPSARFETAEEMLSELGQALRGELASTPEARPPRSRLFLLGATVVAAAVATALALRPDPPDPVQAPAPIEHAEPVVAGPPAASKPDAGSVPAPIVEAPAEPNTPQAEPEPSAPVSKKRKRPKKRRDGAKKNDKGFDVKELEF